MISDTVTMSTYESPEIYGFNDTTICTNQNLILNPGEFSSYQWSNGSTEPTQSMNSNEPTNIVVSVVVTNENNCSAEDSINITIEDCSSLNEIAQIQVYPNPSMNGKFHFLELNNTTFKLFDIQGKEIDYKNITTDSFQTNFKGIAFLRLENEKQTCFKLVFK